MLRNEHEAEEATQRAFVVAWERLGDLAEPAAFAGWLYRLTTNLVISDLRTRARRAFDDDEPLQSAPAPRRTLDAALDLERAIDALPPQARRVFLLHDLEGYKHHEIAAGTGLATGTSKAHLHRARSLLRRLLS
jgi:RNA polymerase sigma-70 factor (ECF subfamily)